jgi:regulatory protein
MKIIRIRSRKGGSARVVVELEGEIRIAVATEIALRAGLHEGAELDELALAGIEREDLAWRVHDQALRLLGVRPRTRLELRNRLARTFPEDVVDACLDRLTGSNLLDDREFARLFARERLGSRPHGRGRILRELRQRGVEPEQAENAIREALESSGMSDLDLARAAAGRFRRRRGEDEIRARRRLHGYLARRGFAYDTLQEVVREHDLGAEDPSAELEQ